MDEFDSAVRVQAVKAFLNGVDAIYDFEEISMGLSVEGWNVFPVYFHGLIVGAIIEKNGDIHTSISKEYQRKWNPRPYIKSILIPILRKYGRLYSEAKKTDPRAIRWLTKLGFYQVGEDADNYYYEMVAVSYKKLSAVSSELRMGSGLTF